MPGSNIKSDRRERNGEQRGEKRPISHHPDAKPPHYRRQEEIDVQRSVNASRSRKT